MEEKEDFRNLALEWEKLLEKYPDGVHWPVKNPNDKSGILIKVGKYARFYPVAKENMTGEALADAAFMYRILTDQKLMIFNPKDRTNMLNYFDQLLAWYANHDSKPKP